MMIFIAFIVGLLTDWVWAKYFKAVSRHAAVHAANWSVGIYLCGVFATYLFVDKEYTAMASYAIGGWIGTFFAVSHGENNNGRKDLLAVQNNSLPLQQKASGRQYDPHVDVIM